MATQYSLFGIDETQNEDTKDKKYTKKIQIPIYEPKSTINDVGELVDTRKVFFLTQAIKNSNVTEQEKDFLLEAAHRFSVFNYSKCADYYAQASKEMQELMERLALVIIDFDKAIEYGYAKLADNIANLYMEEMNNDAE